MEKKLQVRDLRISFHTPDGRLQAVRGIGFDLAKGETLAIVGESGSGKTVTSKAILGLLAENARVESGEILYDGRDLLKISEKEFQKIRGGRIAMVFQDPMSSLNPVIRIGRQLTEAMLSKGRAKQRESRSRLNACLKALEKAMAASGEDPSDRARARESCKKMKAVLKKSIELERAYHTAHEAARDAVEDAAKIISEMEQAAVCGDTLERIHGMTRRANAAIHRDVVPKSRRAEVRALTDSLKRQLQEKDNEGALENLRSLRKILEEAAGKQAPDFFGMSCGLCSDGRSLPETHQRQNDFPGEHPNRDFLPLFLADVERAIRHPAGEQMRDIRAVMDFLKENVSGAAAKVTRESARHKAIRLMEEVGIAQPCRRFHQYPYELSGGMRQRIVIAIALAADPEILICDEPTTALDVTIQAQILALLNRLKEERGLSVIFITHDLGVVARTADRVAVMYAGQIVEYGDSEEVFYDARHPYTWALLSAAPDLDAKEKLTAIPGSPPNLLCPLKGDAFAPRNPYAMQIDLECQPPLFWVSDTHYAATWLLHPDAPRVDPPRAVSDRIARMEERRRQAGGGAPRQAAE